MEHRKWLLDVLFAEDVGELSVHLHIEEDVFTLEALRDGRDRVRFRRHILGWEDTFKHFI